LIIGTEFENKSLEDIIKSSTWWIFNNASQVWNHTFYWNCLIPNSKKSPSWKIAELINKNFWNFEKFREEFTNKAIWNFGSGWTWLVQKENSSLEIVNTSNANTPLTTKDIPLFVIDIWEHAYYIDVKNIRAKYIENLWNLVNWEFVEKNLM
jgi:Fe-Mn family superoxide dismutase